MTDADLLERFVASFSALDELVEFDNIQADMIAGTVEWGLPRWKPVALRTPADALAAAYQRLPGRFPPLYEELALSYRWLEVELDDLLRLLPNPPGPSLTGLLNGVMADPSFVECLFPLGFVPFAKAPGDCYDPICFDTQRRQPNGDCPVVRFDHENILCDGQPGPPRLVANSFRELVGAVIDKGLKKK